MKNLNYWIVSSLMLTLLFGSCSSIDKTGPVQYEYLLVERHGGGQLDFRIYPGDSRSNLNIYVSSSNFLPVERRFQIHIDKDNVDAIDDFYNALNGKTSLKGTVKMPKGLTGSWLTFMFVRNYRQTEVTNPELVQRFAVFEGLVREVLEKK